MRDHKINYLALLDPELFLEMICVTLMVRKERQSTKIASYFFERPLEHTLVGEKKLPLQTLGDLRRLAKEKGYNGIVKSIDQKLKELFD